MPLAGVRFGFDSRQVHSKNGFCRLASLMRPTGPLCRKPRFLNVQLPSDIMTPKTKKAIRQLKAIEKIGNKGMRLAAEGWSEDWKVLISTILSAQTRDEVTIIVCEKLFKKYPSARKLGNASLSEIKKIIKPINFYKTKSKNIKETAKIISKEGIPETLEGLIKLPGVGRKVGNVYLAEAKNADAIGVDTHVARLSQKLEWTKNKDKHKIEKDLERLFPRKYWRSINYILVTFGRQHWTRKKDEDLILNDIYKMH